MIVSLALFAATASGCTPVPGADGLWQSRTRWVVVGEIHGTNETPDAFTNLVCLAAATGRPVTVAVEFSADWQPVLDAYLASDGGSKAQAALLTLPVWKAEMQDGRGSVASLRMLDRFRRMKLTGGITGVSGFDIGRSTPPGQTRDAAMAKAWTAMPAAGNGIILALTGNIHAMRRAFVRPNQMIVTAGSLMPPTRTMTVNVVGSGGKAWTCQSDGCGEHANGPPRTAEAGMLYSDKADHPWGATYELGRPTTAAAPAIAIEAPARLPSSDRTGND